MLARHLAVCGMRLEQHEDTAGMNHAVLRARILEYFRTQLDLVKQRRGRLGPFTAEETAGVEHALMALEEGNAEYWHLLGSDNARAELDQFFKTTGLHRDEYREQTPKILDEIRKARIGAYRAILEHSERLSAYDFSEPLSGPVETSASRPTSMHAATISETVEAFFREHDTTSDWTSGTVEKRRAIMDFVVEWFGPETMMAGIGKRDAAALKAATLSLPTNRTKAPKLRGLSLREAIAVPNMPKISNATVNAYISIYKIFWAWSQAHGFAQEALFAGMSVGKKGHGSRDRRAFTPEALVKAYSALTDPDSKFHKKTSHKWATLIAMFSGARLNEVCQLQVNDIIQSEDTWIFNFTEEGDTKKRLKSSAVNRPGFTGDL